MKTINLWRCKQTLYIRLFKLTLKLLCLIFLYQHYIKSFSVYYYNLQDDCLICCGISNLSYFDYWLVILVVGGIAFHPIDIPYLIESIISIYSFCSSYDNNYSEKIFPKIIINNNNGYLRRPVETVAKRKRAWETGLDQFSFNTDNFLKL